MSAISPTNRQRRKEARPQELLAAALDLFVEKGFAATKTEDVATRAGVAKGTLYLYYPSKEELLKAVVRENLSGLIAEGATIASGFTGSTQELLLVIMQTWWERVGNTKTSGIFKVIITEMGNFPDFADFYMAEVMEPGHQLFMRILQRGIDKGELRQTNLFETVHVLIFPMLMLCLHKHSSSACAAMATMMDPLSFIKTHVDVVLHGLLVRHENAAAEPAQGAAKKTHKTERKTPPANS